MGKGDQKTKRGKIIAGSYGVRRRRKANSIVAAKPTEKAVKEMPVSEKPVKEKPVKTKVVEVAPEVVAEVKKAPKKPTAIKTTKKKEEPTA